MIYMLSQFQKKRVSEMCSKHVFPREQKLPIYDELQFFFRHLMFDDKRKAIFCFVPKVRNFYHPYTKSATTIQPCVELSKGSTALAK